MSFWKSIKRTTTVMVESIKQTTGNKQKWEETDEAFINANEHYETLRLNFMKVHNDLNEYINTVPLVYTAGSELATITARMGATFPEDVTKRTNRMVQIADQLSPNASKQITDAAKETVIKPVKEAIDRLDYLTDLKKRRHTTIMLLEANEEKLVGLRSKDGKEQEVVRYEEKVATKKDEIEKMSNEFIAGVEELWRERLTKIQIPAQMLVNLLFTQVLGIESRCKSIRQEVADSFNSHVENLTNAASSSAQQVSSSVQSAASSAYSYTQSTATSASTAFSVAGGSNVSASDVQNAAQFASENRETVVAAAQFANENRETVVAAAQFANEHQDEARAAAQFANEHQEEAKAAANYAVEHKEQIAAAGKVAAKHGATFAKFAGNAAVAASKK